MPAGRFNISSLRPPTAVEEAGHAFGAVAAKAGRCLSISCHDRTPFPL